MAECRAYSREELAQMPFGEVVDYINELWDEIVELKRALEGHRNKLDKKEDYIGRLQMKSTDMQEEIQKLKAELNSPIGYLDLELVEDKIGYAPTNFELAECENHYSAYAKHLMRKYEALTDSGFSHDDAMSLIPLWDDADFENFKKGN